MRYAAFFISALILITSCKGETQQQNEPIATDPSAQFEYKVGLGYGFLGKEVRVKINGREVISVVGTDDIEQYAQLQGTTILASGSSPKRDIIVQVIVDNGQPYEQTIDLSAGIYIHVYLELSGLHIFNTPFLILE
jgi:hypothetical protein